METDTILVAGKVRTREELGIGDPRKEYRDRNRYIEIAGVLFSQIVFLALEQCPEPYICSICGERRCKCTVQLGTYICPRCCTPLNRCTCTTPLDKARSV